MNELYHVCIRAHIVTKNHSIICISPSTLLEGHQENSKMLIVLIFYLICLNPLINKLKLSEIREKKEQDWTYSS